MTSVGQDNGAKFKRDYSLRIKPGEWKPSEKFKAWVRAYKIRPLAVNIGVQRITVYKWLNGERPPHPDSVAAMVDLSKKFPCGLGPLTEVDILARVSTG